MRNPEPPFPYDSPWGAMAGALWLKAKLNGREVSRQSCYDPVIEYYLLTAADARPLADWLLDSPQHVPGLGTLELLGQIHEPTWDDLSWKLVTKSRVGRKPPVLAKDRVPLDPEGLRDDPADADSVLLADMEKGDVRALAEIFKAGVAPSKTVLRQYGKMLLNGKHVCARVLSDEDSPYTFFPERLQKGRLGRHPDPAVPFKDKMLAGFAEAKIAGGKTYDEALRVAAKVLAGADPADIDDDQLGNEQIEQVRKALTKHQSIWREPL